MTPNKQTVTQYMDALRATDPWPILSCLTEDVAWRIPGMFEVRGKAEFANHIVDEGFVGKPVITVARLTEENDVVIAEGSVRAPREDGVIIDLAYCDVFVMIDARIVRLVSN